MYYFVEGCRFNAEKGLGTQPTDENRVSETAPLQCLKIDSATIKLWLTILVTMYVDK